MRRPSKGVATAGGTRKASSEIALESPTSRPGSGRTASHEATRSFIQEGQATPRRSNGASLKEAPSEPPGSSNSNNKNNNSSNSNHNSNNSNNNSNSSNNNNTNTNNHNNTLPTAGRRFLQPPQRASTLQQPCQPLFAGWCDAGMFGSLVGQDLARLQRRLARPEQQTSSGGRPPKNSQSSDPEACAGQLAALLLQAYSGSSAGGGGGSAEAKQWRSACGELAARAAKLEVLLALLAE
ncbi:unnamed protein product, partial [Polarella glacialis]